MNTQRRLILTALLLLSSLVHIQGQTSQVPGLISYQGIVTDTGGVLVGNSAPVNREVIFRIWDSSTASAAGNLVYSERQVVTISKGEFSVLIGQGTAVSGTPLGFSETTKGPPTVTVGAAFAGSGRYLGVTVDDGTAAADVEITPRQQMVSTAFTIRAKEAETVVASSIGTSSLADTSVNAAKLAADAVTAVKIATDAVTTAKILDGTIVTADLAGASVTKAKLGADVGIWDIASGNAYRSTGNVGIGTNTPNALLDLSSATQTNERLRISGNDYANSGSSTAGVSFLLQRNIANRADLFVGYSGALTSNATNTGLRIIPGGATNSVTYLDAIATNGSIFRDLGLNGDSVRILANGNVGVGITAPPHKLDVHGTSGVTVGIGNLINGGGGSGNPPLLYLVTDNTNDYSAIHERSGKPIVFLNTPNGTGVATEFMRIASNGNVGIGTNNPSQAKLVVNGNIANASLGGNFYYISSGAVQIGNFPTNISIWASDGVAVGQIYVRSDARLKNIQGQSNQAEDLATLKHIEITDYTDKDVLAKGSRPYKKVIAQQVEKVFPQAVSKNTDVVPDIYQKAMAEGGWVTLTTDLKLGDRVRLIGEKSDSIHEVLEVAPGRFRTDSQIEGRVFVFGREVKDFRMVDYDAISMLNVSATQELARKQDAKDAEISALNKRLATLEARDKARDARLAAIEKALLSEDKPILRTVSLK